MMSSRPVPFCRYSFQPRVPKEPAARVPGLGDSVRYQNQSVAGMQAAMIALVGRVRQQSNRKISVRWPDYLMVAHQQRWHMPAIDVFELPVTPNSRHD